MWKRGGLVADGHQHRGASISMANFGFAPSGEQQCAQLCKRVGGHDDRMGQAGGYFKTDEDGENFRLNGHLMPDAEGLFSTRPVWGLTWE